MAITERKNIPKEFFEYRPVFFCVNILSHKWVLPILLYCKEPIQFNQLNKKLDVSHTVLSKYLKNMENLLLIKRTVITETNPPSVEYSLDEYGVKFLDECLHWMEWSDYEELFGPEMPKWS